MNRIRVYYIHCVSYKQVQNQKMSCPQKSYADTIWIDGADVTHCLVTGPKEGPPPRNSGETIHAWQLRLQNQCQPYCNKLGKYKAIPGMFSIGPKCACLTPKAYQKTWGWWESTS